MKDFLSHVTIKVNEHTYIKDPESSDLGKKIVSSAIIMMDDLGFDQFTFKKLALTNGTSEASIYRYFENKHKLLLYLNDWYYKWLESRVLFAIMNISDSTEKLNRAIHVITETIERDGTFEHIDEVKLQKVIYTESSKAYFTKEVDEENELGLFSSYKSLVKRIGDILLEVNPEFKYPHMLITTVIEGVHHQRFFAEHLPRLTDVHLNEDAISVFYKDLIFKTIHPTQ